MPFVQNPFIPAGGTYRAPVFAPPVARAVVSPHPVYGTTTTVAIPASALKALNTIHKANPQLLVAALRAVPPPKTQPAPAKRGIHGLGDTTTDGTTASPAATSDWLSQISNFVTTNLPAYLNYNVTQSQIQAGQTNAANQAQTQALLASHGIGVQSAGLSTTMLLALGGGLIALLLILKK